MINPGCEEDLKILSVCKGQIQIYVCMKRHLFMCGWRVPLPFLRRVSGVACIYMYNMYGLRLYVLRLYIFNQALMVRKEERRKNRRR